MKLTSVSYERNPALRKARNAKRTDGVYEVLKTPEGLVISAEYRDGTFHRWVARDAQGKLLRPRFLKASEPISAASLALLEDVPFPRPKPQLDPPPLTCYACYSNPLPTGPRLLCYEVPCR
jgi:hypothetical protein